MPSAGDLVMSLADFNGHIGRHIDGFDGVHGAYDVVQWNWKEECYLSLVCRWNYVCQIRGLREREM